MLKIGSVIDGKYKILNIVGKGGMSIVYLAMNEKANKQWAIKEIRKKDYCDFEMDKKEIEMMKRLKHPNLPGLADVIEEKESLLIVMDYIEGRSLEDLVQECGPLDEKSVIKWAKQLCDVLTYLHTRTPPIIYRDMKPANVMLKPDGNVMLIDFGAAREYKLTNQKDTVLLGTRGYAAPEQYRLDGQSDARTDIYSLGVTMFRLLTGENPQELCAIRNLCPELSAGIEKILLKCTAAAKRERYQTAWELLDALNHYWEYDEKFQREQKRKFKCFLLPVVLMLIFTMGMCGFRLAEISIRENNYEAYLIAAGNSVVKEEELENYKKAIWLDPENEEAYLKLLQNGFLDDGVLSREESEVLRSIFMEEGSNGELNEQSFLKNKDGYAEFAYAAGIAYFYKFEDRNYKKNARGYFEIAAKADGLGKQKRMRANRLFVISDYYSKLGVMDEAGDIFVTYSEYWTDLTAVSEGNIVKEDNARTALVMYEELIGQMISNTVNFRNAGVTKEELQEEIKRVETHLKDDFSEIDQAVAKTIKNEVENLRRNIGRAKKIVESVYTGSN